MQETVSPESLDWEDDVHFDESYAVIHEQAGGHTLRYRLSHIEDADGNLLFVTSHLSALGMSRDRTLVEPSDVTWKSEVHFDDEYAFQRGTHPETGEDIWLKYRLSHIENAAGETVWER